MNSLYYFIDLCTLNPGCETYPATQDLLQGLHGYIIDEKVKGNTQRLGEAARNWRGDDRDMHMSYDLGMRFEISGRGAPKEEFILACVGRLKINLISLSMGIPLNDDPVLVTKFHVTTGDGFSVDGRHVDQLTKGWTVHNISYIIFPKRS